MIAFLAAFLAAASPASAPPQPCTRRTAVHATVVEIGRNPARYLDRCVTVSGAFAGIRMYSGRDGLYLTQRFGADGNHIGANLAHRIGIDNQDMRDLRMRYPQSTIVTGRVDSCERRYQRIRAAGGIPFLGGYCHYESGPTIVVDAYEISGQRFERMTGEAARGRFGNLVAMPADWPTRAAVEAIAAEFLAALRGRDRAALTALHDIRDSANEHDRAMLYDLLDSQYSVFAQARAAAPAQTAIFVSAAADGTPFGRDSADPAAIVCFCRTSDCADRWPLTFNDANNAPGRPYACTKVEPRDWRPRRAGLSTPIAGGWLAEPAQTAFRAAPNGSTR
jgi:hypothetical protein